VARCFLLLIVGMPFYVLARARRGYPADREEDSHSGRLG